MPNQVHGVLLRAHVRYRAVASAATTIYWCSPMSGGMPMPGDWAMSMAWMRMPGQSLLGATASFTGIVMMIAMMLPSLLPMLSIYRRSIRQSDETRLGWPTALAGAGYFFTWAVFGAVAYSIGLVLLLAGSI
jgi:predicted metal-binding membrane protein